MKKKAIRYQIKGDRGIFANSDSWKLVDNLSDNDREVLNLLDDHRVTSWTVCRKCSNKGYRHFFKEEFHNKHINAIKKILDELKSKGMEVEVIVKEYSVRGKRVYQDENQIVLRP